MPVVRLALQCLRIASADVANSNPAAAREFSEMRFLNRHIPQLGRYSRFGKNE